MQPPHFVLILNTPDGIKKHFFAVSTSSQNLMLASL